MSNWDRRYTDRVQLLMDILPALAQESRFALKGGTAINLFEHDLPRLSVDIDLTWLPVGSFAEDAARIASALERLAGLLRARPLQLQAQISAGEDARVVTRLIASRGRAQEAAEPCQAFRGKAGSRSSPARRDAWGNLIDTIFRIRLQQMRT